MHGDPRHCTAPAGNERSNMRPGGRPSQGCKSTSPTGSFRGNGRSPGVLNATDRHGREVKGEGTSVHAVRARHVSSFADRWSRADARRCRSGSPPRRSDDRYHRRRHPQRLRPKARRPEARGASGECPPYPHAHVGGSANAARQGGRSLRLRQGGRERAGAASAHHFPRGPHRHGPGGRTSRPAGGNRRCLATDGAAATECVLRFLDGRLADSLQHRELRFGLAGGLALQTTPWSYTRLWVGAVWRREDFALAATVPFPRSQFGTVGAGLEFKRVRFQVLENFNSFARQEDVDVSQLLHLGFWAAPRAWGYGPGQAGIGPEARGQVSGLWHGGFAVFRGQAGGVVTGTGVDSVRVAGSVTVASQNLPRGTLIFHLEGGVLRRPQTGGGVDPWGGNKGARVFWGHHP